MWAPPEPAGPPPPGRKPPAAGSAAHALAGTLYGGAARRATIAAGATAALQTTGLLAGLRAASIDTLNGVAAGLLDRYAADGARGSALRMYTLFCDERRAPAALPATFRLVSAWLTSRAARVNTAGPRAGLALKTSGLSTSLGGLHLALTASGDGSAWAISPAEYQQLRELCSLLQRALPPTVESGTGLTMAAMWAVHERLAAQATPAARRMRAWLALAVGLALRGTEASALRWHELVADEHLGLALLPTAAKGARLRLARPSEARAAPHLSADLALFCALRALREYAPARVAALCRSSPASATGAVAASADPIFVADDGSAWSTSCALGELRGHLAALGLSDVAGDHLGRDTFITLMQGEIGLSQSAREAAGGWAVTATQPRRYPMPREGLLLDTARAVAALVDRPCCGATVPRCGAAGGRPGMGG